MQGGEQNYSGKLDLLLINPTLDWKLDQEKKIAMRIEENIPNQETPHIGIAYLLAVAKREAIRAEYIDMVMEGFSPEELVEYVKKSHPALVGFTAFSNQIKSAAAIARIIKEEIGDIPICVGGPHATAIPKETLEEFPYFDFVVCGEGENILSKILSSIRDEDELNKIKGVVTRSKEDYSWETVDNLDGMPFPAWEKFNLTKYAGTYPHRTKLELPMISGRGCPYRCVFCCRALGSRLRHRSVNSVITEIEYNIERFKCESIAFLDETFMANKAWSEEFISTTINRGLDKRITWSCSTRVSDVSPQLLKRMRESGCYYIFYGLESADDETLKRIKKNITVEQIKNAVKWTKEAGIVPVGAFIIGLPGDTEIHINKIMDLAKELNLYSVTFPIAVPFPGTELRQMVLQNEYGMRILSDNWDLYGKQDCRVMESDELSLVRRKELQHIAYIRNPKKNLSEYLQKIRG